MGCRSPLGRFKQMEVNCLLRREETIQLSSHSQRPLSACQQRASTDSQPLHLTFHRALPRPTPKTCRSTSTVEIRKLNNYLFSSLQEKTFSFFLSRLPRSCGGLLGPERITFYFIQISFPCKNHQILVLGYQSPPVFQALPPKILYQSFFISPYLFFLSSHAGEHKLK